MLSIGDFARLGQVSVRMLRHYDRIGLLRPAHVAPATGYRSYDAAQLARLNRVVALKDLGFPLEQVRQGTSCPAPSTSASPCPRTPIASYQLGDDDVMQIVVGYAYDGDTAPGFEIIELPAVEEALCGVHLGSMDTIGDSWQSLAQAVDAAGRAPSGPCRELYVRAEPALDQSEWVTELQQPVRAATGGGR